jgi:predicted transcriptional regulator of viral defense system
MAKLMNWFEFNKKMKDKKILLFSSADIRRIFSASEVAANFLLYRYAKKGYIVRVKRGLYAFPDGLPSELFLANKIYQPSYVSLEFALSYYRVIPENVYEITSVTTKATRHFEKLGKTYSYRRIKENVFTGYSIEKQKGLSFQIADPEKAFVDANYFRMIDDLKPISRFNKERINLAKCLGYAKLFQNERLTKIIKNILG